MSDTRSAAHPPDLMNNRYKEGSSVIPGVPVDAPLTVKQHFQQQRKQEMRPSTSRRADQELLHNTNMKIDPRLLGSLESEDGSIGQSESIPPVNMITDPGRYPGQRQQLNSDGVVAEDSLRSRQLEPSIEPYDALFQNNDVRLSEAGRLSEYPPHSSAVGSYCSPMTSAGQMPAVQRNDPPMNAYSTAGEMSNYDENGGGVLEQSHCDSDPSSFDQGVEKLDTETDERFLSWLYCENEHAEDDNAEYTRVLEEIEKDECYPHKTELDNQFPDFGLPTSMASGGHMDNKMPLDPSHPLASDCVVGQYASLPPTVPPREPVPEGYQTSDFESDLDLDVLPIGEDEETLYGRLLDVLVRDIKLLTYNNAALVDEVSRLNYAILIASEERKVLARRSCHHDRNRIRRLQTANKRKSDAQRRQQEQLTIAETQENIAQIKAKMARTLPSPQKVKPIVTSAMTRPTLDVAAIKRSVEAEQRALEETSPPLKKPKRKSGSRSQRRRSEKDSKGSQNSHGAKRGRFESDRRSLTEEGSMSPEPTSGSTADTPTRRPRMSSVEASDEPSRRRRPSRQQNSSQESAGAGEEPLDQSYLVNEDVGHGSLDGEELPDQAQAGDPPVADEGEQPTSEPKEGESHTWRRRSGRPPARAASAAAQTLLAAELAGNTEETQAYSPKRTVRSRPSTSESPSARSTKRKSAQPGQAPTEDSIPIEEQLTIEILEDSEPSFETSLTTKAYQDSDSKADAADDEELPIGDTPDAESTPLRAGGQRLRSIRRSSRTVSRQSGGETEGSEVASRSSSSPAHEEATEPKPDETATRTTRSRSGPSSVPQQERQVRERKQPTVYSPVAKNSTLQQRVVRRKS
ncbi:unnamed protein product [Nippostrongylus brasiliensis]|uniref:Zf-C3H1 domain-containing protein n=1 Tax=Nippostrongylus brasiliensis TaxID=27835 RepID=A0A0N4XXU7_NIPBR|nr:unnamed protein product [Nippostrongylus brasiliensis]